MALPALGRGVATQTYEYARDVEPRERATEKTERPSSAPGSAATHHRRSPQANTITIQCSRPELQIESMQYATKLGRSPVHLSIKKGTKTMSARPVHIATHEHDMPQNKPLDTSRRSPRGLEGDGDLLILRTFTPYFQERCHELIVIDGGCIAAIIKDGELCIRLREIVHFSAPGWDL